MLNNVKRQRFDDISSEICW